MKIIKDYYNDTVIIYDNTICKSIDDSQYRLNNAITMSLDEFKQLSATELYVKYQKEMRTGLWLSNFSRPIAEKILRESIRQRRNINRY